MQAKGGSLERQTGKNGIKKQNASRYPHAHPEGEKTCRLSPGKFLKTKANEKQKKYQQDYPEGKNSESRVALTTLPQNTVQVTDSGARQEKKLIVCIFERKKKILKILQKNSRTHKHALASSQNIKSICKNEF